VSPQTVERFVKRFSRYGFRREAMTPVYGLAENSVALSVPKLGLGPRIDRVKRAVFESEGRAERADASDPTAIEFACEGPAIVDHEVRIVDDAGAPLPDRHVGRLVFRGPSMTSGYYRNPQATAAITLPDGWLDSGDLAYMAEGEIYVTGRLKDVIIKGGRNIVPHEIEEAASEIHGVRKGCVVALGVMSEAQGTESLVVVAETRETDEGRRDALCAAIRERVDEVVGLPPDQVVLVPPGGVPKTSSGKIRRASTKEMYVAGELGRTARLGLGRRLGLAAGAGRALGSRWAARARRVAYGTYVCLAIGTGVLLVWPAAVLVRGRRASAALERLALRALVAISGCKVTVEGLEHLPRRGPALLASNHTSYADIPFLRATIPLHFVFVAKQEALGYPLVGIFFRKVGHIAVDRDQAERSVTDSAKAVEALARGDAVLYFPEGTFTSVSGLRPFKLGLFKAAVETRTPIIPMALRGSRRVLRDGSWIPHPRHVSLWIGPPIHPGGTEWSDVLDLRDRVAEAIAAHCGEPRLDLVSASRP
jgi:1-acyl-sn-glycerol-3-phosphate acyltransferase